MKLVLTPTSCESASMPTARHIVMVCLMFSVLPCALAADPPVAENRFRVDLAPPAAAQALLTNSLFGINTAFGPGAADLAVRLEAMQQAGIKWGRQDFNWKSIEKQPGAYDWLGYDSLVEACARHGLLIFGNLAYGPSFHDPRTPDGVEAYAALARPPPAAMPARSITGRSGTSPTAAIGRVRPNNTRACWPRRAKRSTRRIPRPRCSA